MYMFQFCGPCLFCQRRPTHGQNGCGQCGLLVPSSVIRGLLLPRAPAPTMTTVNVAQYLILDLRVESELMEQGFTASWVFTMPMLLSSSVGSCECPQKVTSRHSKNRCVIQQIIAIDSQIWNDTVLCEQNSIL